MAARTITTTATLMPALAPVLREIVEVCWVSAASVEVGADVGVPGDVGLPDEDIVVDVADVADTFEEAADETLVLVPELETGAVDEGMKSTIAIVCARSDCGAGASNVLLVLVEHS